MEETVRRKHKIIIQEAINGFVVEVGCVKPIVFTSWKDLKSELEAYYQGKETKLAKKVKGVGDYDSCTTIATNDPEITFHTNS